LFHKFYIVYYLSPLEINKSNNFEWPLREAIRRLFIIKAMLTVTFQIYIFNNILESVITFKYI